MPSLEFNIPGHFNSAYSNTITETLVWHKESSGAIWSCIGCWRIEDIYPLIRLGCLSIPRDMVVPMDSPIEDIHLIVQRLLHIDKWNLNCHIRVHDSSRLNRIETNVRSGVDLSQRKNLNANASNLILLEHVSTLLELRLINAINVMNSRSSITTPMDIQPCTIGSCTSVYLEITTIGNLL